MARRTSRRSPKVVWLPPFDGNAIGGPGPAGGSCFSTIFHTFAGAGAAGNGIFSEHAQTFDSPAPETTAQSLADQESSGYRLRRIVGKIWVDVEQVVNQDSGLYICTAAFMVRRVDNTGVSLSTANEVQPASMAAMRDPWIWRRSWVLTNAQGGAGLAISARVGIDSSEFGNHEGGFPLNDGPHVDQKTARVIADNERLFLSFHTIAVNAATGGTTNVRYMWHTRCLASMRTNLGNRRNAAR